MPTYQYECSGCGHGFDEFQYMSDKPLVKCPKCGRDTLNRLIGAGAGIIFKGSGFYETDYKRKSPPPSQAEGQSGKSADSPKAETAAPGKKEAS